MSNVTDAVRFIAENRHVYLLGRRTDAFPTGYPMNAFADPEAKTVSFSTYRASAKVKNLLREGVAAVLSRSYGADGERWVVVRGPISLHEDAWFLAAPRNAADAALLPDGYRDTARKAHESGKRCVLRIDVEDAYTSED